MVKEEGAVKKSVMSCGHDTDVIFNIFLILRLLGTRSVRGAYQIRLKRRGAGLGATRWPDGGTIAVSLNILASIAGAVSGIVL